MDTQHFAILIPLMVGIPVIVATLVIHAGAVGATVYFVRRERGSGLAGTGFWIDVVIVGVAVSIALAAHLVDIAVWALVFLICGEFTDFGTALYHSCVNYTTLGYGDLVMTPRWRFMGPLEAANGMLMFGVTTAVVFAVMQR